MSVREEGWIWEALKGKVKTFKIHSTKFSKNYALSYNLSTDKYLDLELKSAMHVV